MFAQLTPIERCADIAGLAPHEIMLGVTPSKKHERLLSKYCRARRSPAVARAKIVADIRTAVSAGAAGEAADLFVVLRRLLAQGPSRGPRRTSSIFARRRGLAPFGRRTNRALETRLAPPPSASEQRSATVLRLAEKSKIPSEPVV
ncbi:hypothetical protein [Methylocystis parvus]|uniref:Polysaccharide deacetylase n=1 Tax=Methylocystis parvus TaxID=134 RepID=A0A6B8M8C9_9HYPH|nr:hypothetical protein [Methylocystis parvus]QGM98665.1 polysaccharide deacetylase [Methylocystis parvus]WBK00987.1 polysaccharide deacetylase [Methylocystis parvus OBBP]